MLVFVTKHNGITSNRPNVIKRGNSRLESRTASID